MFPRQSSQGNQDLIAAAMVGGLTAVAVLLARPDVDKNYQDEVGSSSLYFTVYVYPHCFARCTT